MKKAIKIVLALALVVLCLTAVAAAAGDTPASGICDVKAETTPAGITMQAMKVDGTVVSTPTTQEGKEVYADAVKVKVTYSGATSGQQYLVFVLNDATGTPTESNVVFIDQADTVAFEVYPKELVNGTTYTVYLSSDADAGDITAATKVGSFGYYAAYKLGDVNSDTRINTQDAMLCFNHFTGKTTLTGNQFLAADVLTDGKVNVQDGMKILNYFTGKITEF